MLDGSIRRVWRGQERIQIDASAPECRVCRSVPGRVVGSCNMDKPVTEIPLRKRSTPYGFAVTIKHQTRRLTAYEGASANFARTAYWQAVHTLAFLRSDGEIELVVTLSKKPYGRFETEVESSGVKSLHVPTGECTKWMSGSWSGDHLVEKMLATVPGMPGPSKS
jgi:hypothetical protein